MKSFYSQSESFNNDKYYVLLLETSTSIFIFFTEYVNSITLNPPKDKNINCVDQVTNSVIQIKMKAGLEIDCFRDLS